MNIQPTVANGAAKTDERAGAAALPAAAAAKPAAVIDSAVKATAEKAKEPTSDEVKAAVKHLNESITSSAQDLQFSVDEDSKRTVVKLIDRNTLEVLRQMPSKEALEIAKSLDKAMGKLIDQHA